MTVNEKRLEQIGISKNGLYKLPQNTLINIICRFLDDKIFNCEGVKNELIEKKKTVSAQSITFKGKNYTCTIRYEKQIPAQKKNITKIFNFLLIMRNFEDSNKIKVCFKNFVDAGIFEDSKSTKHLKAILEYLKGLKITYKDKKSILQNKSILDFEYKEGIFEITFNEEIALLPCFYSFIPTNAFLLKFTAFNLMRYVCVRHKQAAQQLLKQNFFYIKMQDLINNLNYNFDTRYKGQLIKKPIEKAIEEIQSNEKITKFFNLSTDYCKPSISNTLNNITMKVCVAHEIRVTKNEKAGSKIGVKMP